MDVGCCICQDLCVIPMKPHASWGSSEFLWLLAVLEWLGGLGEWEKRTDNTFFFTLAGCWPFPLQIPVIPASCMPAVTSTPRQEEPSLSPLLRSRYCPDLATGSL